MTRAQQHDPRHENSVRLVGRLSGRPEDRELPSGDMMGLFRLVVDRGPSPPRRSRPPKVDTIDCVAWSPGCRRQLHRWETGDLLEVDGALRRRFWRNGAGVASRYEVEVASVRRVGRAGSE